MSTFAGISPNSRLVTSFDVNSITLVNCTLVTDQTGNIGIYGGYQVKCYHTTGGCGNPASGVFLELKDNINWTWMACEFELQGTGACWAFNNAGFVSGYPAAGNMLSYNQSLGDIIPNERCLNTWENPSYQTHSKVYACDNDANNFFRFTTTNPKTFLMKRRRNVGAGFAGPEHSRSCNSFGVDAYTIIKNIYIW